MEEKGTQDIRNILDLLYDGNVIEHKNLYVAHNKDDSNYTIYIKGQDDFILSRIQGIGVVEQDGDTYYVVLESIENPYAAAKLLFDLMSGAFSSMLGSFNSNMLNSYLDTNKTDYKYKIYDKNFEVIDEDIYSSSDKNSVDKFCCSVNDIEYIFVSENGILVPYNEYDALE